MEANVESSPDGPGVLSWLSPLRLVVLLAAMSFLAGAIGFAVSERTEDPLSATDVGFMQDMSYHHEQAVQMSLLLLYKDDVDEGLKSFAKEILVEQRFEMGIMNATLDRFGYATQPGPTAMGWMGPPVPLDEMEGLATEAEMAELADASGAEAESLWIALMSEHHLGGMHMADWAARKGEDRTTTELARAMVATQRGEVIDLNRYRENHGLPLADGFDDPTEDQRLDPLSVAGR